MDNFNQKKIIGIIPSRYASSRFPGKPLADIAGKSMIQRVYETAAAVFDNVWVATDDQRIYDAVSAFGGNAVMTSEEHPSGTDRCSEAVKKVSESTGETFDVVVNIQGDEPFIKPSQLTKIAALFDDEDTQIGTLVQPITKSEDIFNPNIPKVVLAENGDAIYFSRSPIPYVRNVEEEKWMNHHTFFGHIGLYAYRTEVLHVLTQLKEGRLEKMESLEQLRWLEHSYRIRTDETNYDSFGIDTPEDLEKVMTEGIEKYLV